MNHSLNIMRGHLNFQIDSQVPLCTYIPIYEQVFLLYYIFNSYKEKNHITLNGNDKDIRKVYIRKTFFFSEIDCD